MFRPLDELINDGTDVATMEDKDFIIAVLEEYAYFSNITVSKKAIEAMQNVLKTTGGYDMEASMMELQEELQYLIMCCGVEQFDIMEIRENGDPIEYTVAGLGIEIEQELVLMSDMDNIIQGSLENGNPLLATSFQIDNTIVSKLGHDYVISLPNCSKVYISPILG